MIHKVYDPEIRARLGTAAHFCEVVVLELRTDPIGTALRRGFSLHLGAWFCGRGKHLEIWGSCFDVGVRVQGVGLGSRA